MATTTLLNPHRFAVQELTVEGVAVIPVIDDVVFETPPAVTSQVAVWWANDLAVADGAAVTSWVDRVSANNAAQGTGSLQPIFRTSGVAGHPAVDFDGSDDVLRVAAASAVSFASSGCVLAVILADTISNCGVWGSADEASDLRYMRGGTVATGAPSLAQRNNDTTDGVDGDDILSPSTAYFLEWSSSGTSWTLRRNNDVQSLTVTTGSNTGDWFADVGFRDNFTIGALQRTAVVVPFNGKIALLIVADAVLSSGDRTAIYDWVSDYYGITMA